MHARARTASWQTRSRDDRRGARHARGARRAARDGRGRPRLRRSRHPVRHHDQPLEPGQGVGPHQLEQPVLRVHVPRRHGLQPREPEPDEVRRRGRRASTSRRSAARRRSRSSPRRSWSTTPTIRRAQIARNSHLYRPLGLGYANLGALLMSSGLPYDSDEGRNLAAAITVADVRRGLPHQRRDRRGDGPVRALPQNREPLPRGDRDAQGGRRGGPADGRARDLLAAARASWARRSSSAGGTATRTRRSPCSRRPARSPS